jgi:hypothetical protein
MKNETVIKDGKWVWPKIDENSWVGQNEFKELANKVMPLKNINQLYVLNFVKNG